MSAGSSLARVLQRCRAVLGRDDCRGVAAEAEPPLRSALFSADQMEQHGRVLATAHALAPGATPDFLLARLAANESELLAICRLLTAAGVGNPRITPPGEWLLDNFYLIDEQIRTAKRHLPRGYSRELPCLARGPSAGRPRVYDIALEAVAHGDGRVDTVTLTRFVAAYQGATPLRLGELWAIPIMLRLALIENLRRVGMHVAAGWTERSLAGSWADRMIDAAANDPKSLILLVADMARSDPPMVSAFVAEIARRLKGRGPALALPLTWIAQRLGESGHGIEQMVQSENQQQAADQVSISNSIGSLRVLGTTDWRDFVEGLSLVEQTLRGDPGGVYAAMDFATRDRYRHVAENLARNGPCSEVEVARLAVELARGAAAGADAGCRGHVGFYLIDRGLPELERAAGRRLSLAQSWRRRCGEAPLLPYLLAIAGLGLVFAGTLLWLAGDLGPGAGAAGGAGYGWRVALAVLALPVAGQAAVTLVNWLVTLLVAPQPLPRMDFANGIAADCRCLVVVPTMLSASGAVESLVEALEVRFLANQDRHLHFALLTDFLDAPQVTMPGDAALLEQAGALIEALNRKYVTPDGDRFFLFHRGRRWNAAEGTWMGQERKRGKLAQLNSLLLRGVAAGDFARVVGDAAPLVGLRYVITLDTDTQLPRDSARQLVGTMAHPLNRPRHDPVGGHVVAGYGILQPRVSISLPGTNHSRHARLYGGEPGLDPYTRAVSDVYQDLFGEGSFIGKGIYDLHAFERALEQRFPDNGILSHDLIEGCFARSGLLSDVQLYEDCPISYAADVARRHRWIRGDWQLAAWLWRRVPVHACADGGRHVANPLSLLSQWKLIDNLRRSATPAALLLAMLLGWLLLAAPGAWTLGILGLLLATPVVAAGRELWRRPDEATPRQHLVATAANLWRQFQRSAFELACLPHEAWYSTGAIGRTLWRTQVSRRRLLEWNPSSEVDRQAAARGGDTLEASVRAMWFGPALAVATAAALAAAKPVALAAAVPVLFSWLLAPGLAWWGGRPLRLRPPPLSSVDTRFLRRVARRTWAFFEHFVAAPDHWLPPDNYQEYRTGALAHRTSPTNIGLALLANLAAHDFGYIGTGRLVERTADTLRTLAGLERHRGHCYNWYDTRSLQPLAPLYVSSVDSGNLAGHLLTLRAGLAALGDQPVGDARLFDGLGDCLAILAETVRGADAAVAPGLERFYDEIDTARRPCPLTDVHACLERLSAIAAGLVAALPVATPSADATVAADEAGVWAGALARQCRDGADELAYLAPWLVLAPPPPGLEGWFDAGAVVTPSLRSLTRLDSDLQPRIALRRTAATTAAQHEWLDGLQCALARGRRRAGERLAAAAGLAQLAGELAEASWDFLYDKASHLLSIGYDVGECRADSGYYDLLASEARLGCFVAIAQGKLPQAGWFALGRLLTGGGEPVLLSWSGSMFEYLMPLLVMPTYDNTLLDQTARAAVARQIEYGRQRGVPWGISESGYNAVDVHLNYQYRAFGVPGLGLKRGLGDDLVVAPYASALALMVAPAAACRNLQRLAADGLLGRFGFVEAVDYTPSRQRRGQGRAVVRSYMAHHQGMSLLALAYTILDRPMQRRFGADPCFQAVMLLLQERIPKATARLAQVAEFGERRVPVPSGETPIRIFDRADTPAPEVQLLSNGRYHVMLSNAGGGYSRWQQLAVTRWEEDGSVDDRGSFCYLRDLASGDFWSSTHQPTRKPALRYEAIFSEGRVEFRRDDAVGPASDARSGIGAGEFETHSEVVVSPEDDIELRRIRVTNRSPQGRSLEVTSYAEVVLAPATADALHPAFSKLFVQTEILRDRRAILCTRRPRSADEQGPWMLHLMAIDGAEIEAQSFETDRMRFVGRTRSLAEPSALTGTAALSGSEGSVLDPVVAVRCSFTLASGQSAIVDIVTGIADSRMRAVSLVEKYQDRHLADRVFDLGWTHSQVVLRQINAGEADAQLYARLAGAVIHANGALRGDPAVLARNRRGQSALWGYAISGDLPIVLLQIGDAANIELVRQLLQAHAYWRLKGLAVDLVIWNEDRNGYRQQLQEQILGMIASGVESGVVERPGGIFVRHSEQISAEDRVLFESVARAVINDGAGPLEVQLERRLGARDTLPRRLPGPPARPPAEPAGPPAVRDLILGNGLGGFTRDGREYVIELAPGQVTPAPWVNVLANPQFGTVVSESGSAYTWSENAHAFRLSPWTNDPVGDASGEAIYLRDEESGQFWSPTPLPAAAPMASTTRHGFGYSVFETRVAGICSELWVYVAVDAPVKFSLLKLRNDSGRPRRLSATAYVEWVLGDLRARSAMHVSTWSGHNAALLARNPYSPEFAECVAFLDCDEPARSVSGDRREFIGRNGSLRDPAAMYRPHLSGRLGAGLDPCAAMRCGFDLAPGATREIVFRLGVGRGADAADALLRRFGVPAAARGALEEVWRHWERALGAVQVETPDPSVDVLVNGWLPYQVRACRLWARSGFYQSGGAFGFRDQLQDAMALVQVEPALLRAQLLLCASRQFPEGDVQHWWHPPAGRGVRTRCSDDFLWLPLAACRYVAATGDTGVLDVSLPFLEGRPVNAEDDSWYDLPGRSASSASLYEHCRQAVIHGLRFGSHGLPLIGSGDWNDGMNLVGMGGKGESVWLGFFLGDVLRRFAVLAGERGDGAFADRCRVEAERLLANIEQHGWDGAWYRRAYFDDGTPLGSAGNDECRIDSIAQSWSVLGSGGGDPGGTLVDPVRQRQAMAAVDTHLVRRGDRLIQLLDPPFDHSRLDPGYIRGYVPGVRENGGQYTHAAVWAAMAFAELGERERAWELLDLINPVHHAMSAAAIATYKVEPYVMAADVCALPPHTGRGGWTWYTGSAGWMYRLIVESLLGLRIERGHLHLVPCLPPGWRSLSLCYRYGGTSYRIGIRQAAAGRGVTSVCVDGALSADHRVELVDDGRERVIDVLVGGALPD